MNTVLGLRDLKVLTVAVVAAFATCGVASAYGGGGHGGGGGGGAGHAGGGFGGGYAGGIGGFHGGAGYAGGVHAGGLHSGALYGGFRGGPGGWRGYDRFGRYGHGYGYGYGWGRGGPWLGYDLFLSTLPFYYSTLWWDGVPYYYADNNYYLWDSSLGEYQAVDPPQQVLDQKAVSVGVTQLYAYPTKGQDAQQQARDRQQCENWAAQQASLNAPQPDSPAPAVPLNDTAAAGSGVAGTHPGEAAASAAPVDRYASEALPPAKREQYLRAEAACLTGRGYSVN